MSDKSPTKILVITSEDAKSDLQSKLEGLGYAVSIAIASSETDAVVWVDKIKPELVLINMPADKAADRAAMTTQIRRQFEIPIIYLISHTDVDTLSQTQMAEPDGNVVVPFDEQQLYLTLETIRYRHYTQRKTVEDAWRKYAFIVDASKDFMTLIDRNHVYVAVNQAYCRAQGKTQADMVGKALVDVWGQARYEAEIKPLLEKCLAGEEAYYQGWFEITGRGRRCFDVAYYPYYDSDNIVTHAVVISRDITTLKLTEEEVRRSNRELVLLNQVIAASATGTELDSVLETTCREVAQAFDVAHVFVTLFDAERKTITLAAEYWGADQSVIPENITLNNNSLLQTLLNHQAPLVINNARQDRRWPQIEALFGADTTDLLILPLVVDGSVVGTLNLKSVTLRTFSTSDVNLAWSVADQVVGALARMRLNEEHRRLSTAIEQTVDSVIITDIDGNMVYVNPAFEETSQYHRDEVIGQNPRMFQGGQHEPKFYQELWQIISSGQVWQGRFVNRKKDETFYTVDATITPVRNEEGEVVNYVALERNVTRVLQLEEQLRQSQKMEAIGRLAGGVAHDFNNILTVINGHSELLLQRYMDTEDPLRWEVEQIQDAGERAAVLTHQLLAFSRRQTVKPRILNINEVVTGLEKMLRRLLSADIELLLKLDPDLGVVKADLGQMEQVFMNLVVNARDAMPNGGKIMIETSNIKLDETYVEQHVEMTPGPYTMLTVTDSGVGLDADTKSHIFEPFFTTKEAGKGTGLGLSTVYGIIRQNKGFIWVYSEVGQGTTFKIYLPRIFESEVEEVDSPPNLDTSPIGSETILLVEDEANVRLVACKFLQKNGYNVIEAGHPKDALKLCQAHNGAIDLLVTDVIMPDLNGRELAERLGRIFPDLKVLYISGYAGESLNEYGLLGSDIAFLEKPFSSQALIRKVRETLDAS